ncbi:MAG: hypothetical protein EA419_08930 [Wenzhouxiangella sp.]|nr:MAG: hypothetical protein EA419_08930 [Wenzhouxiangella sp.]
MNKQTRRKTNLVAGALLLAAAGSLSAASCGDDYCIDWFTIGSGGEMFSESADPQWTLSGTIGQWDATEARASTGGGWQLTGGFWGLSLEELADFLFRDRFEEDG